MDVNGTVAEGFEPVRDAFVRNFEQLGDRGAAVTVYRDGHKVVDLWAGTKDVDGGEPWQRGTAQIVRSATKGVAAAVPLMLAERGRLDLDAPVGEYWPEFKAHGKERVLVRQVLNHRAGLPVLDRPITPEQALDPLTGPEAVAAQTPVWEPGTDHGYHALTYGWLLDELVRRVTGRGTGEWIAEQIAGPLGAELWLGLPETEAHRAGRVGRVDAPEAAAAPRMRPKRSVTEAYQDPDSLTNRAFGAITPSRPERPGLPGERPARDQRDRHGRRSGPLLRGDDRRGGRRPVAVPGHGGAGTRRGVRRARPRSGGQHAFRARLHAARQRGPVPRPGLLRPPRPRRLARLRRPRVRHRLRLCDQRPAQDGHGGSAGAGAGAGGTGSRIAAYTWIGWDVRPDAASISPCALVSSCMASSLSARAPATSSPTRG